MRPFEKGIHEVTSEEITTNEVSSRHPFLDNLDANHININSTTPISVAKVSNSKEINKSAT
jgi:hypothetical protein